MKTWPSRLKIALALEVVFFSALLSFVARPGGSAELLVMLTALPTLLCWLASLFLLRDKMHRRRAAAVVLLAPAFLCIIPTVGPSLRAARFRRDLPRLREVVHLAERGQFSDGQPLPAPYQSLAYAVRVERKPLRVTFYVGGGFPVKHEAYVYRADDSIDALRRDWPRAVRRLPHWFEASD